MKKSEKAVWNCSIDVDCPYCGEQIDLLSDYNRTLSSDVWNPEVGERGTDRTRNIEVYCNNCDKDFIVPDLEW